jgi:hypothetical protein
MRIESHIVCFFLAEALTLSTFAQSNDSISGGRNVIKYNASTTLLYSSALVFSYERILSSKHSFAITGGSIHFPDLGVAGALIQVAHEAEKSGFTAGAEYRFYLLSENKYAAPRGVYIGPYINHYSFHNERVLDINSATGPSQTTFNTDLLFTNFGFQVGYQFILAKRFSIDMIFFGPSLSNYALDLKLGGNLTVDEEDAVIDALLDRMPFLGQLLDGETISANGRTSTWSGGYRFTMLVGYKFGWGKKH